MLVAISLFTFFTAVTTVACMLENATESIVPSLAAFVVTAAATVSATAES